MTDPLLEGALSGRACPDCGTETFIFHPDEWCPATGCVWNNWHKGRAAQQVMNLERAVAEAR